MSTFHATAGVALWLMLCLAATAAAAQDRANAAPPASSRPASAADPGDARTPVPPVRHRSAFTGYRALGASIEVQPGAWREANDRVARIGGWRTYSREAHAPEPAASAASAGPAASAAKP